MDGPVQLEPMLTKGQLYYYTTPVRLWGAWVNSWLCHCYRPVSGNYITILSLDFLARILGVAILPLWVVVRIRINAYEMPDVRLA